MISLMKGQLEKMLTSLTTRLFIAKGSVESLSALFLIGYEAGAYSIAIMPCVMRRLGPLMGPLYPRIDLSIHQTITDLTFDAAR